MVGVGLPAAALATVLCLIAAVIVHNAKPWHDGQRVTGEKLTTAALLSLIGALMLAIASFQAFLAPLNLFDAELGGPPPTYPRELAAGFPVAAVAFILAALLSVAATVRCFLASSSVGKSAHARQHAS